MLTAQCPCLRAPVRRGAVVRNGHRRKPGGIRSRAARVAGAALVLAGAGLTVTGVAEAVSVPGVSPNQLALPLPTGTYAGSDTGATTGTATGTPTDASTDPGTASATDPATGASGPTAPPTGIAPASTATATPTGPAPTGTASASATAPATDSSASTASATAAGPAGGPQTPVATQPQPRQSLAETGTDQSVPWLLAGGATLVAGGALFRFGPRRTPSRGHGSAA